MKKKNDLILKVFEGHDLHTFVWNGRVCWVGKQVINILDYSNSSKVLSECIEKQGFEVDIEYKILRDEELSEFRKMANDIMPDVVSVKTRNLIILYEPGLYGVFQYSTRPQGIIFGQWIRRVVVPELREKGYFVLGEDFKRDEVKKEIVCEVHEVKNVINLEETKKTNLTLAYDLLSLVERAVEKGGIFLESTIQVLKEVGIDIKEK